MESEELGVGIATSKTGQVFVVCNYNPPGNFIGSFAENVPPIGYVQDFFFQSYFSISIREIVIKDT